MFGSARKKSCFQIKHYSNQYVYNIEDVQEDNYLMILIVLFMPRPSENMLIRVNNDGTYCANWTPGAVGLYTIHVTIDGIEIGT